MLGLVSAGGLGGWIYLQRGDQRRQDASEQAARAQQRAEIDGLSSQVSQASAALQREQQLKEQLRAQLAAAAADSKRQVCLMLPFCKSASMQHMLT